VKTHRKSSLSIQSFTAMNATTKQITIRQNTYDVVTDIDYGARIGSRFEPHTVAIMEALIDPDSRVIDIGANIGFTSLALAQMCPAGRVAAVEPVPATYELLSANVRLAALGHVSTHNFALGKEPGEVVMQGNPDDLSGFFVSDDHYVVKADHHREAKAQVLRLDDALPQLGLDRIDMLKIDVEGFELDVLEGASEALARFRPRVFMEMNHVALNLWRGIALPEFRKRLLKIFPFAYAIGPDLIADLSDDSQSTKAFYAHVYESHKFTDLVCGFDKADLAQRLALIPAIAQKNDRIFAEQDARSEEQFKRLHERLKDAEQASNAALAECHRLTEERNRALSDRDRAAAERDALRAEINEMVSSKSWKLTSPLRNFRRTLGI
jgi:FkbM family methyltransferase